MITYRVIMKVGYYERWFEFNDSMEAVAFAGQALNHSVVNEDTKETVSVMVKLVNKDKEKEQEEQD